MANQTMSTILNDPSQERKSKLSNPFDVWGQNNYVLDQTGSPKTKPPDQPAEFERYYDHMNQELTEQPKSLSGEFRISPPVEQQDPFNKMFDSLREAGTLPSFPDLFPPFTKKNEPQQPIIAEEMIAARKKNEGAMITSLKEQLASVPSAITKGFPEAAISIGRGVNEQALLLMGITLHAAEQPSSMIDKASKRIDRKARVASGLEKRMLTANRERGQSEQERLKAETQEKALKMHMQAQTNNEGDPLTQTGAKKARGMLGMFGAVKKKAQAWFSSLKNTFVQMGHIIKKWLGGEQQAANRQG